MHPAKTLTLAVVLGVAAGASAAALLLLGPYDRMVVRKQPVSQEVRADSVHLSKGGFVVVYLDEPPGSTVLGASAYLPAGYYTDIHVPIDYRKVVPDWTLPEDQIKESHDMFARLFIDNGDKVFDEFSDTPVMSLDRKPLMERFALTYGRMNRPWHQFIEDPVGYLIDAVIP